MNLLLCLLYVSIVLSTLILMFIIIQYFKQIYLDKQSVKHLIMADLAFVTTSHMLVVAIPVVIRSIVGPFENISGVENLMILLQTNFNILLACIISLQLLQVLNVFCLVWLSEISDKMVITFHRIFVILLGLSTSATVCHFKVGVCKPNPIYFFFLQDYVKLPHYEKTSTIPLFIFVAILASCQAAIEAERYLVFISTEQLSPKS
jgi:hypothetical protein